MNNTIQNSALFIVLVLLQVLVFNNINLFDYLDPYIYILFIFLYPINKEKGTFMVLSFFLGLTIDFFENSGGINAAASLLIAYVRLPILSRILNKSDFDYKLFSIQSLPFGKAISYIISLTVIHHFMLFSLEYFSFNAFGSIFSKTLLSTLFTVITIYICIVLFTKKG